MLSAVGRFAVCALVLLLAGCRFGVSVFEGGDVLSASDERHCFEGGTCEFVVDDPFFTETFTAAPRWGYEFVGWHSGEAFLCGGSTDPVCTVTLDGDALSHAIVNSGQMGYLMPEFACTGFCPQIPNHTWHVLDDALDAMAEARELVSAYVAANGEGAPDPELYGVQLRTRNSWILANLEILPADATLSAGTDHTFYIIANVYRRSLSGQADGWFDTIGFALSGQTNSDNSMQWTCIPSRPDETYIPNGPDAIPEPALPFECRG